MGDIDETLLRRDSIIGHKIEEADEVKRAESLGRATLALLAVVGIVSGLVIGCTLFGIKKLSLQVVQLIWLDNGKFGVGFVFFVIIAAAMCGFAAFICKLSGTAAVLGSGMPETKHLLASDFHPAEYSSLVSGKIMVVRLIALVISLASGLAISSSAPLIHISCCIAYLLMKHIPQFSYIFESSSITKQIFAAAAAVGSAAVLNSPIGGLLFSLEVTSTYYLLSNYWRSFMAVTLGAIAFSVTMMAHSQDAARSLQLATVSSPYQQWELIAYGILGLIVGYAARSYLKLHQTYILFARPYCIRNPVSTAALGGALTAVVIYSLGYYNETDIGVFMMVRDVLKTGKICELSQNEQDFGLRLLALTATLIVRMSMTLVGVNLRLSAGLFGAMFLLGGIIGRIFGIIVQSIFYTSNIYIGGYALVGAVGFVSGTTHTISGAVIGIEMTGQLSMLLPCLISAVFGSAVPKLIGPLSLYDQGMMNKGLETIQLLLNRGAKFQFIADLLDSDVLSVTHTCTVAELFELMGSVKQVNFPVIDDADNCKLLGSLQRKELYHYLRTQCEIHEIPDYIRQRLPEDAMEDDARIAKQKKSQRKKKSIAAKPRLNKSSNSKRWFGIFSSGDSSTAFQEFMGVDQQDEEDIGSERDIVGRKQYKVNKEGGILAIMNKADGVDEVNLNSSNLLSNHMHIFSSIRRNSRDFSVVDIELGPSGNFVKNLDTYKEEGNEEDNYDEEEAKEQDDNNDNCNGTVNPMMIVKEKVIEEKTIKNNSEDMNNNNNNNRGNSINCDDDIMIGSLTTTERVDEQKKKKLNATASPVKEEEEEEKKQAIAKAAVNFKTDDEILADIGLESFHGDVTPAVTAYELQRKNQRFTIAGKDDAAKKKKTIDNNSIVSSSSSTTTVAEATVDIRKLKKLLALQVDVSIEPLLPINTFPFTSHYRTPVEQIYVLFEMVRVSCVFVVDENRSLRGMISKLNLLKSLKAKAM